MFLFFLEKSTCIKVFIFPFVQSSKNETALFLITKSKEELVVEPATANIDVLASQNPEKKFKKPDILRFSSDFDLSI